MALIWGCVAFLTYLSFYRAMLVFERVLPSKLIFGLNKDHAQMVPALWQTHDGI